MCGLAGFLSSTLRNAEVMRSVTSRMTDAIAHRGPDDIGVWVDAESGVALGFRRLAIVDLSAHGHQPMRSVTGRYFIVFNGEVYNHRSLRRELEALGCAFRGHSDTEVILAAFESWGVERAVRRFIGMFAIAVWDVERRELALIRDRLGIKPMYVYQRAGLVSFGSDELAFFAQDSWRVSPKLTLDIGVRFDSDAEPPPLQPHTPTRPASTNGHVRMTFTALA